MRHRQTIEQEQTEKTEFPLLPLSSLRPQTRLTPGRISRAGAVRQLGRIEVDDQLAAQFSPLPPVPSIPPMLQVLGAVRLGMLLARVALVSALYFAKSRKRRVFAPFQMCTLTA
jgi:hypothetical protein